MTAPDADATVGDASGKPKVCDWAAHSSPECIHHGCMGEFCSYCVGAGGYCESVALWLDNGGCKRDMYLPCGADEVCSGGTCLPKVATGTDG